MVHSRRSQIDSFMLCFRSRQSACAFGRPDPSRDKPSKKGFSYLTLQRSFNAEDVEKHLAGRISIVAIPLLENGSCAWGAIDIDQRVMQPDDPSLAWFPSKSGGWHGFIFFDAPVRAAQVRALLRAKAEAIGFPKAEVFPKQDLAVSGNGLNLPFFGAGSFAFEPVLYMGHLPEVSEPSAAPSTDDEEGYWTAAALLAMLEAYRDFVPGFDFEPCRDGYAVPCPGDRGGWSDGAKHSVENFELSHECIVFLKNGWPKFRCVHAHCDGGTGVPKKTINDWRMHWDPERLWEWDRWVEEEMSKRGDYVRP